MSVLGAVTADTDLAHQAPLLARMLQLTKNTLDAPTLSVTSESLHNLIERMCSVLPQDYTPDVFEGLRSADAIHGVLEFLADQGVLTRDRGAYVTTDGLNRADGMAHFNGPYSAALKAVLPGWHEAQYEARFPY